MISFPLPDGGTAPLEQDDYYVQEEWAGWEDTLCFSLPAKHPQRPYMTEYLPVTDRASGQQYRITTIDEGKTQTDLTAVLDLTELQAGMLLGYTNGSDTAAGTIAAVLPPGWTVTDASGLTMRRTVKADGATPLDVIKQCPDAYPGLAVRFDNAARQVLLTRPADARPSGVYFTDELNLTARPQFKGKAKDFYTRLYAVGKDGMTFAELNDGKSYVECHDYTDQVICRYWKDERYTVAENLLAAAQATVNAAAVPERSYECSVVDLAKIDPAKYAHLSVAMYQAVTLIDREQSRRVRHQVARYRRWPHHPEKNVVTLSTVPGTISGRLSEVYTAVTDTSGLTPFAQRQAAAIEQATGWLTSANGYVVAVRDESGAWVEQLFLDAPDQAAAKNVLRINANGIGFSTNGIAGPYTYSFVAGGNLNVAKVVAALLEAETVEVNALQAASVTATSTALGSNAVDLKQATWQTVTLANGEELTVLIKED